jgi:hypothetical protein
MLQFLEKSDLPEPLKNHFIEKMKAMEIIE